MNKKELNLEEIQKEMLNTVLKIDEICDSLGIKYALAYGSLIGAIRHNDFIPWDDDIDIWMSKNDLDVFTDYCRSHKDEIQPFKLCDRSNVQNYSYNISRFSNFDFQYVNTDEHQQMFDIGVFVDIYPIESFGNSKAEAYKLAKKSFRLSQLYDIYINPNSRSNYISTVIKKLISFSLHAIYKDKYYLVQQQKMDKYIADYSISDSKYVGCARWTTQNPVLHNREDVFDVDGKLSVIKHEFSEKKLNILKNYDIILKNSYGNYMELPPEEKRHPHHDYRVFKRG